LQSISGVSAINPVMLFVKSTAHQAIHVEFCTALIFKGISVDIELLYCVSYC
jgi:hypothetical protein